MVIDRTNLKSVYEQQGIKFENGNATITVGNSPVLILDENVLLDPSSAAFKSLAQDLSSLGFEMDLFDVNDPKYEEIQQTERGRRRTKTLGRIFHHWEIKRIGFELKKVNYYTYLKMSADEAEVALAVWNAIAAFLTCVIGILTLVGLLMLIGTGVGLVVVDIKFAALVELVKVVCASCLAIIALTTKAEQLAVKLYTRVDT